MIIQPNQKLVMIGDSITDCDRKRPVGEGLFEALGRGYSAMVDAAFHSVYPDYAIRVVNMGIGGNTVRDLKNRWTSDVLEMEPDWVSVMIGTNDVWRQFDQPTIRESHVYLDEYRTTLGELVERTLPAVKGMILMTPFYLEPNPSDAMRATMDHYGKAVKEIAERYGCLFVDTQAAFAPVLRAIYPATLAWDRVHPNMTGHLTLARAFLKAIGFDWNA